MAASSRVIGISAERVAGTGGMYGPTGDWKAYQPFLPSSLRCEGDREPVEEHWAWRGHDVPWTGTKTRVFLSSSSRSTAGEATDDAWRRWVLPRGGSLRPSPDLPGYGHTRLRGNRAYTYPYWVDCVEALIQVERDRDGRPIVLLGAVLAGCWRTTQQRGRRRSAE